MADLEKVKKSLHCCTEDKVDMGCSVCEYRSYEEECTSALAFDALSVIEDQQKEIDRLKAEQPKWISVIERMPDNANKPGAFCPKLRVLTPWGETYGWFNPDRGRWFFVDWFLYGDVRDFERGDIAKISQTPKGSSVITHWMPITKAGEQDADRN